MKIGTFMQDGSPAFGMVLGCRWLDIPAAAAILGWAPLAPRLADFVAEGDAAIALGNRLQSAAVLDPDRFEGAWHALESAQYLPPFYPAGRLFTQRGNSCLFSRVVRLVLPEHPIWERRYTTNLVGHNHVCGYVGGGCNPEFVAVIGRGGKDISPGRVMEHVFGYTMMIDHAGAPPVFMDDWGMAAHKEEMVFRDHMFSSGYYGNCLPPNPVGPWVVSKDEIPDPYGLWISAEENYGQPRMIEMVSSGASLFRFEDTLAFMSRMMTLRPGDMLSTSSIGNDGYPFWEERPPGSWFQTTCQGIGSLRMYLSPPAADKNERERRCP